MIMEIRSDKFYKFLIIFNVLYDNEEKAEKSIHYAPLGATSIFSKNLWVQNKTILHFLV